MKISFDTNIAVYACNESSVEHEKAVNFLNSLALRHDVAVSEFMLVELYLKLRNNKIFQNPMTPSEAVDVCQGYRSNASWELVNECPEMDELWKQASKKNFAIRRVIDLRLGLSLVAFGVTDFATTNTKDFQNTGFAKVWNPLE
ncbi:MAG: TA system VapC family ribonuclease toxin [Terrimicrobiaceae bacterium]